MTTETLHLLTSALVREECLDRLQQLGRAAGRAIAVLTPTDLTAVPSHSAARISAAFLSDDVLGDSSKTDLTPEMAAFCGSLDRVEGLQWVQVPSAGVDRPQFLRWLDQGVTVCNAGGVASTAVAQSAIGGMLALARKMPEWMDAQRRQAWEPLRGSRAPAVLEDRCVMVVGLGAIGQEIARLCKALRMHVIGVSRSGADPEGLCDEVVAQDQMDGALARCDWLVLACPLTPATQGLIGAERLARLPRGAAVVDVSRGGVVSGVALDAALAEEHLAGAYLDVFETEPLPAQSPFWRRRNVLVSPHSAGDFSGRHRKLCHLFCTNVQAWLEGRPLRNALRK